MSIEEVKRDEGQATKYDAGKPRYSLIPKHPLAEVAKVYTMGAVKYGDYNWMKGMQWSRPLDALVRHLEAWRDGETHDQVDGQHHLSSVIWNAMTLMEYERLGIGTDDRVIDSPVPKLDIQALLAQATQAAMEAAMRQLSYAEPEDDAAIDRVTIGSLDSTVIRSTNGDIVWQAVDGMDEEHEDRVWDYAGDGPLELGSGPNGQTEHVRAMEISASSKVE